MSFFSMGLYLHQARKHNTRRFGDVVIGAEYTGPEALRTRLRYLLPAAVLLLALPGGTGADSGQGEPPEVPRIQSVEMAVSQPHDTLSALIWYDDFDGPVKHYTESSGGLDQQTRFGDRGGSMLCTYEKGTQGTGNRKVFFGDSPYGVMVRAGESFEDVYWRIYVMHQYGWQGGQPAKMSRATSLASSGWNQAMIAHVWGSGEDLLTLDPATGVSGDRVVTTKYNDFTNLRWLGNSPPAAFRISSAEESGWWVCVEARARLNTPGQKDGLFQLWMDGKLETERTGLDWRGGYTGHGINAVFLEAYWNSGSPVTQYRWYDNFVVSTQRVGPVAAPLNPVIYKRPYHGPGEQAGWEVELAADREDSSVVWRGAVEGPADSLSVGPEAGEFCGRLEGGTRLAPGTRYCLRARQQSSTGAWSDWSAWHQEFQTEGEAVRSSMGCDYNGDGQVTVADVIMLLLIQRDDSRDERGDYNSDGRSTMADAVQLLIDWKQGRCGLLQSALLSGRQPDYAAGVSKMEGLADRDREYLERCMERLPMAPELKEAFRLALYGRTGGQVLPEAVSLSQNTPNPFNPTTEIAYLLPQGVSPLQVTIQVFDLRNQLVCTLVDGLREPGRYSVFWDGTDEEGTAVASGIYLYRLSAGKYTKTRKMILLK
ncbi:MAG: hypothetical protein JXQ83_14640 [Candidatus Glassbacteria bacterium]|nr:hypothetical protein [Candidatus Glassbacteria bacterium]